MSQNRRTVLDAIYDKVDAVTVVKTVTRSLAVRDILNYNETDLPLVDLREPRETADVEMTSMRQIGFLDVILRVWFTHWGEDPSSTYETLMKDIRNKLGEDPTMGQCAVASWVTGVSNVEGEMPLFRFDISLRTKYHLNLANV